jgi:TPR repeat protein
MVPSVHHLLIAAQFLVDDALQILSSLSQNHESPNKTSTSVIVRFLWRLFDILKSLSFLQSLSQEEPLTSSDSRQNNLRKAMQLLQKAAESDNSDAMYLLGELNFVKHLPKRHIDRSMEIILELTIPSHSNGSKN